MDQLGQWIRDWWAIIIVVLPILGGVVVFIWWRFINPQISTIKADIDKKFVIVVASLKDTNLGTALPASNEHPNLNKVIGAYIGTLIRKGDKYVRVEIIEYDAQDSYTQGVLKSYGASLLIWGRYYSGGSEDHITLSLNVDVYEPDPTKKAPALKGAEFSLPKNLITNNAIVLPKNIEARIKQYVGVAYYKKGEVKPGDIDAEAYKNSIYLLRDALSATETGQIATSDSDNTTVADLYHNIGNAYKALGDYATTHEVKIEGSRMADVVVTTQGFPTSNTGESPWSQSQLYNEAVWYYEQAIEHNSKIFEYFNNLGTAYYKMDDYTNSLATYTQAYNLVPRSNIDSYSAVCYNLAEAYRASKLPDLAIAFYQKALIVLEGNPSKSYTSFRSNIYNRMGLAMMNADRTQAAAAAFTDAINMNDRTIVAAGYSNRGIASTIMKQFQQAEQDFNVAIGLIENSGVKGKDMDSWLPYYNFGLLYHAWNKYKKAQGCFLKVEQISDNNLAPQVHYEIARVYAMRGCKDEALKNLQAMNANTDLWELVIDEPDFALIYNTNPLTEAVGQLYQQLLQGQASSSFSDVDHMNLLNSVVSVLNSLASSQRGKAMSTIQIGGEIRDSLKDLLRTLSDMDMTEECKKIKKAAVDGLEMNTPT